MADGTTTTADTTTTTATTTSSAAATPWYQGKADPETIGHWQNKGWDATDPATIAIEATKAHREAQKFIGVPADKLIRLPADLKDEAGWKDVWGKLGAPADPKDYDLSTVKDQRLADALRQVAAATHLPKDAASTIAQSIVKHIDGMQAEQAAVAAAKLAEEKTTLAKNWGDKFDFNHLKAMEGARRLGISPEAVKALENQIGYAAVMDAMRKIGSVSSEDAFIEGGATTGPVTSDGAQARLNELMKDQQGWAKRLLSGDPAARAEFDSLTRLATGITEIAA